MKLKKIVASNISKTFQGKCLFNDLSLSLSSGDFMMINGDNGVGKSTLIKVLIGLIKSDSGSQSYLHSDNFMHSLGYISSNLNSFYNRLTVEQNLNFFIKMRGLSNDLYLHQIMDEFSLNKDILKKKYMHLSSGERKKVSILRAFVHKPSIIFMDEPLNYLDKKFKYNFIDFISKKLRNDNLILITASHEINSFEGMYNFKIELKGSGKHLSIQNKIN